MSEHFRALQINEFLQQHLDKKLRPDGRTFTQSRDYLVNSNSIATANGSSIVKVGRTNVICGIVVDSICRSSVEKQLKSMQQNVRPTILKPFAPTITTSVDQPTLQQLALSLLQVQLKIKQYATYELRSDSRDGELQENLILSQQLRQVLLESQVFDQSDFCAVENNEQMLQYSIEVMVTDLDGNVFDAALFATLAALRNLRMPANLDKQFRLRCYPISTSWALFERNNQLICLADPLLSEQRFCDGFLTLAIEPGTKNVVLASMNGSTVGLSEQQLSELSQQAIKRAKEMESKLKNL